MILVFVLLLFLSVVMTAEGMHIFILFQHPIIFYSLYINTSFVSLLYIIHLNWKMKLEKYVKKLIEKYFYCNITDYRNVIVNILLAYISLYISGYLMFCVEVSDFEI